MKKHVPADHVFGIENGECTGLVKPPAVADPPVIVFIGVFDDLMSAADGQVDVLKKDVPDFTVPVALDQGGALGISAYVAECDIVDIGSVTVFLRHECIVFHNAERDQTGSDGDVADQDIPNRQTGILTVTVMAMDRDAERAVGDDEIAERTFPDRAGANAETNGGLIRT